MVLIPQKNVRKCIDACFDKALAKFLRAGLDNFHFGGAGMFGWVNRIPVGVRALTEI